ncbi:hypothetical protein [Streptomyces sp. NPDC047985]|uniref:hypothetical protein n=1 Tax=unclassified Streptomyces TaxID=2593676 RepID=UPI0034237B16
MTWTFTRDVEVFLDAAGASLTARAREERHAHHGAPHPDPCLCHECLPVTPG